MATFSIGNEDESYTLENEIFQNFMKSWLEKNKMKIDLKEIIGISCDLLNSKSIVRLRHEQTIHDARTNATEAMKSLIKVILKKEQVESFIVSLQKHAPHLFKDLKEFHREYKMPKLKDDSYLWEKCVEVNPYENNYIVNSKVRGHILIINNEFAKDETLRRYGSGKDVLKLSRTFEDFYYKVHVRTDLTKKEMLESVEDFVSNSKLHSDCHSGGLIVMSHGNNEIILDVQSDCVTVVDLLKIVKGESSCLRDKPIFVIFQTCKMEIQKIIENSLEINYVESFIEKSQNLKSAPLDLNKPVDSMKPYLKDIIIMFSCFPIHLLRRHSPKEAIFIEALCDVIQMHGSKLPWQELCQKIVDADIDYQNKYKLFSAAIAPEYHLYLSKNFYLDTALCETETMRLRAQELLM